MTEQGTDGIILVHGALHTSSCWGHLLPLLATPARAIDLPGRGARPADVGRVTLADCVEAVIEEADGAGFGRVALVGHSLGGVTITETAYLHPERVSHLVYVGAVVPPPGLSAAVLMTGAPLDAVELLDDASSRALFGNDLTDEQWAEHARGLVPDAPGIINAQLSGYPSKIPMLYVGMDRDVPVPPDMAEQIAANLGPDVVRRSIDAGHSVMVSAPQALADLVNAFVAT